MRPDGYVKFKTDGNFGITTSQIAEATQGASRAAGGGLSGIPLLGSLFGGGSSEDTLTDARFGDVPTVIEVGGPNGLRIETAGIDHSTPKNAQGKWLHRTVKEVVTYLIWKAGFDYNEARHAAEEATKRHGIDGDVMITNSNNAAAVREAEIAAETAIAELEAR